MKEALELAKKFKEEGKYDLFRGQAQNWEVVSSASRINDDLKEQHLQTIQNFYSFCSNNELLRTYTSEDKHNEFIAIAQHYSGYYSEYNNSPNSTFCELKTNFIDFTSSPEIAMFFATHSKSCEIGQDSVIVCLNKNEFENEINNGFTQHLCLGKNLPIPQIIEVDLTNLWRLEAQKGCFMELQLIGFDKKLYGFDRICFPYSEPFDGIQETDIYPERKSPIENELDKFFIDMRMSENAKIMRSFPNVIHIEDKPPMETYNKIFQDFSRLLKHSSWNNINSKWNNETHVKWEYTENREHLQIDIQKLASNKSIYFNQLVDTITQHRNRLIDIEVINGENFVSRNMIGFSGSTPIFVPSKVTIIKKIKTLYDGMNSLPYSNEDIVNAIKELLHIELEFEKMIDKVEVEIGERDNGRGYYSRAFIFGNEYQSLLRDDILEYINLEYLSENENSNDIKTNISKSVIDLGCDISLIFDFNKLVDLFAKRIIPFQIYLSRRSTILFNPARIKIFGRP
jgi:hypothetical protein